MPEITIKNREFRKELKIRMINVRDWFDEKRLNRSYSAIFLSYFPELEEKAPRIVNVWKGKTIDECIIQKFEQIIEDQGGFHDRNTNVC